MTTDIKRRRGFTHLSGRNQVTLPMEVVTAKGFQPGQAFRVEVRGEDIVLVPEEDIIARRRRVLEETKDRFRGMYPPGYLDKLRESMGLTVVDASVSIAIVDADDALYEVAAAAVQEDVGDLVLPAAAYTETMVRPHRVGDAVAVRAKIDGLGFRIEALTEAMAEEAARLRARFPSLRLGDALVIATATVLEADTLLTGDRRWAAVWDRVRVLEP